MMTIKQAAQSALAVQSASNLSGVVHGFARAMEAVYEHEQDALKRRSHPVAVLFATQVAFLTGVASIHSDPDAYGDAYRACEEMAQ